MRNKQIEHETISAGGSYGDKYPPSSRHPRGSVLIYTFIVLLLMTLMGAALMVNSRTELSMSGSTVQGRDAFAKGDATARVALLIGRAYLQPTAGNPWDYVNVGGVEKAGRQAFDIIADSSLSGLSIRNLAPVEVNPTVQDILTRYLRVTEAQGRPHMTVTYGTEVVGTAFINLVFNGRDTGGGSIGERDYSSPDSGYSITTYFVITSQGRLPKEAGKGYITEEQAGTHSIVSTIFREVLP